MTQIPPRVRRAPTLRDVAEKASVSIKTVSRVVNGESNVADGTLQKVRRAVEELGYIPNIFARRLVCRRSHVLALVYKHHSCGWLVDFQKGALSRCLDHGYDVLMRPANLEQSVDQQSLIRLAERGSVDGLILTPPAGDCEALLQRLRELNVPFVRIAPDSVAGESAFNASVTHDDWRGAHDMTRYLIGLGHKRIAFVTGNQQHSGGKQRLAGFRAAMLKAELPVPREFVVPGDFSFESGLAAGRLLLRRDPRPTAIFASNDAMAAGVLQAAHQAGVRLPEQLSVAGYDDTSLSSQVYPPLTTVRQPTEQMAAAAAEMLIRVLDGENLTNPHRVLPSEMVPRESTGPAPS